MRQLLAIFAILLLVAGGVYAYRSGSDPKKDQRYHLGKVTRGSVVATVAATGNIEPILKVLVGSQVSGTVIRWYTDFNQTVKEGDILAELDQDQFRATIAEQEAAVAAAKARAEESAARLENAELDLRRIKRAHAKDSATDDELQEAQASAKAALAALHVAEAQVRVNDAKLQAARIQFDKTIIRSPIDGIVISRDVDAGQTVAASLTAPTLFTIANDLARMRVNAAVTETDIGKVIEGMPAKFRVDAYPERRFDGIVTQVRFAETVVDNVVTYETLIEVDNSALLLRPGMTATVIFEVDRADDALIVPDAALRFDPDPDYAMARSLARGATSEESPRVYKLAQDKLVPVEVTLGLSAESLTQILSGDLAEGDTVVVGWDLRNTRSNRRSTGRF